MRAARKLQQLREAQAQEQAQKKADENVSNDEDEDEDDEDDIHDTVAVPAVMNPFDLLDAGENEEDEEDEEVDHPDAVEDNQANEDEEQDDEQDADETTQTDAITSQPTPSRKKSKKNKKKSKKSQDDHTSVTGSVVDGSIDTEGKGKSKGKPKKKSKKSSGSNASNDNSLDDLDEIDRAILEINSKFGELKADPAASSSTASSSKSNSKEKPLFWIDPKKLSPDAELRKMYGASVLAEEIKGKRFRKPAYGPLATVKTVLVTPRDTWPRYDTKMGLIMDMTNAPSSSEPGYFDVRFGGLYYEVQRLFLQCVNTHDPETMGNLLRNYPFHVDALLQCSEISKSNGDINTASEYIERALYTFERSFHSMFNIVTSNSRLPYATNPCNRALFLALSRHIGYTARRGCWRTCLEFCKLLFSLDPDEDPMGVLLMIDFYALKADEFKWIDKVWKEWSGEKGDGIVGLPNLSFMIAYSKYHEELKANLSHDDSTKLLQNAILSYPSVVTLMLEKCAVTESKVAACSFFQPHTDESLVSDYAIEILVKLYVERCHHIWKEPEVLMWLRKTACAIAELVEKDPSIIEPGKVMRGTAYPDGLPLNACRHIYISEFQSLVPLLPAYAMKKSLHAYDPMPPDTYEELARLASALQAGGVGGQLRGYAGWMLERFRQVLFGHDAAGDNGEEDEDDDDDEEEEEEDSDDELPN